MFSKTPSILWRKQIAPFCKYYATAVNLKIDQSPDENASSYIADMKQEWLQGSPFKSVPGPTKFQMLRGFVKGGDFAGKTFDDVLALCRRRYGDIFLLPGMFGQNTNLVTYNIDDYQKIFRTEGQYPQRPGTEVITHYRLTKTHLYDADNLGVASK